MNMKLSAPLFGLALLACGNAQALVIDPFSVDQWPVLAFNPSNNPASDTLNNVPGLGVPNANRTISADVFSSPLGAIINTNVGGGAFNVSTSQTTVDTSVVVLDYTFPSVNLAITGNEFVLQVPVANEDFTIAWFLNGESIASVDTTWTLGSYSDVHESFSYFNPAALAALTELKLEITSVGRTGGFSGVFDNLETQTVPEPATFSLMALGLAGLGWSRRRRA